MEMKNDMTVEELGNLMIKHGLTIRAIPYERTGLYEAYHKDKYPDGVVRYREDYKRDMLHTIESNGNLGGKFLIEQNKGTGSLSIFSNKPYNSLQEAVYAVIKLKE